MFSNYFKKFFILCICYSYVIKLYKNSLQLDVIIKNAEKYSYKLGCISKLIPVIVALIKNINRNRLF